MKLAFLLFVAAYLSSTSIQAAPLPRSVPEAEGISSAAVLAFVSAADEKVDQMNSFMLVRHGRVIAEGWWAPYAAGDPHMLYSLSKSFTSTAVGMAIADGKLSLDDTVLSFFPDDAPAEPSDFLKAMRVRDLLTMNTGHHADQVKAFKFDSKELLTKAFLAQTVGDKPGTHFEYNTPATYMCSAIVQKVTGQKVLDYLRPRLFEPLGIEHPTWTESAQGITFGGFGLNITTEDIAKFGQLYLQKGQWNGRQLMPAEWVAAATSRQVSNGSNPASDWEQGYGYQFWRARHGLFRGDGAFGQFCIVMPEQDAVLAITSGTKDMGGVMQVAWDKLLPAFEAKPLASDEAAHQKLQEKLADLRVPTQKGEPTSPLAAKVSGAEFGLPTNDQGYQSIRFDFDGDAAKILLRVRDIVYPIECRSGVWNREGVLPRLSVDPYSPEYEAKAAASGAWIAEDTYTVKLCMYETPFDQTLKVRFAGDEVTLDSEYNVAFGSTKQPSLVGRRKQP